MLFALHDIAFEFIADHHQIIQHDGWSSLDMLCQHCVVCSHQNVLQIIVLRELCIVCSLCRCASGQVWLPVTKQPLPGRWSTPARIP